jgi:integrase
MAAIIDDFLEYLSKNRALHTYRWYRDLLQKFILLHKDLRIDDIRPYHVQRWVDGYSHLAKTSRRNHMRSVKRCVKWAVAQGYLDHNPLEHLSIPVGDRKEVVVSDDEYDRLLDYASPESLRDLIVTTWETGCRPQESLRVEARHVDTANQRWVIPPSEAKGERITRIVYLTDKAFKITKRLMVQHPNGPLFRNANGGSWTTEAVNCAIDRTRIRIGKVEMKRQGRSVSDDEIAAFMKTLRPVRRSHRVEYRKTQAELRYEAKSKLTARLATTFVPRHSLYAFRHSFATHALERGVDSVTVAVLMGHTDPSMLAKVYQHLAQNPKFMLEQAKKAATRP